MGDDEKAPHRRLRLAGVMAVTAVVVAAATAATFLVVGPHLRPSSDGEASRGTLAAVLGVSDPVPIAGPVTPAAFPYDQLAILRRQRLSTDVLPSTIHVDGFDSDPAVVAASARLLATKGDQALWLAVSSTGGVCVLNTMAGGEGYSSGCSDRTAHVAAGAEITGVGFGSGLDVMVMADGTPKASAVAGYRQIEQNVWLKKGSAAVPAPAPAATKGDPFAFPTVTPYSHYAILRRAATTADAVPAAWTKDDDAGAGPASSVVLGSLRYAGTYDDARAWVAVSSSGGACLIVELKTDIGPATACGDSTAGVGLGAGDDSDHGDFTLVPDRSDHGAAVGSGGMRLASNVWVAPPS